jgi:hypothetical protein
MGKIAAERAAQDVEGEIESLRTLLGLPVNPRTASATVNDALLDGIAAMRATQGYELEEVEVAVDLARRIATSHPETRRELLDKLAGRLTHARRKDAPQLALLARALMDDAPDRANGMVRARDRPRSRSRARTPPPRGRSAAWRRGPPGLE